MSAIDVKPSSPLSTAETAIRVRAFEMIESASGITSLTFRAISLAVRPPYSWWRPAIIETSLTLRRCLGPLCIGIACFMLGYGFFVLGGITVALGAQDKEAGAVIIGFLREASVWCSGMIFAGVAGSAMCADLGARKVREELDALAVLGVDQVRTLIVPKVIAGAIAAPMLGLLSMLAVEIVNFGLGPAQYDLTPGVLYGGTQGSLLTLDVIGAITRYVIIGIFVAVVSSYKGLSAGGGTEGVGKAVNQTIVLTFFGIWMLDAFFNLGYLSLFPQAQVDFKG